MSDGEPQGIESRGSSEQESGQGEVNRGLGLQTVQVC